MKNKIQEFFNEYNVSDMGINGLSRYINDNYGVSGIDFIGKKECTFPDFLEYMASPMKEMTLKVAFDPKPLIKHVTYIKSQLEVLEEMIEQMKPTLL